MQLFDQYFEIKDQIFKFFGYKEDWRVIGKATIDGRYNFDGEYDEEIDIIEFEKCEVPVEYFDK